jgi:polyisoprenoid-binding protein YceI
MKTKSIKTLLIASVAVIGLAITFMSSCKKENTFELLTVSGNTGTDVIDARIGGIAVPPSYTTPGAWKVDKTHSNVMWETKYYANGALLTGRFNIFEMKVNFDQANPANSSIKAWVQLSTYNTGEPGRDAYGKCGPGYMGVAFDTLSKNPTVLGPRASTDTAWFTSTSIKKYGNGYLVTGDFKFRGVTRSIDMPMSYTGISTSTNATTGKKTDRAGLQGEFGINALTVFGVTSTSIADLVTIRVDCNMVTVAY